MLVLSKRSAATLVGWCLPRMRSTISYAAVRFGESLRGGENPTEKFALSAVPHSPSFVSTNSTFSSVVMQEQEEEEGEDEEEANSHSPIQLNLMKPTETTNDRETDEEKIAMCRSMFSRFARGQELLRRNHGVPVLHQQDVLDQFTRYLNVHCRVPAEVIEMLEHMRGGSLMNNAGGTSGGRLLVTKACMNREPAFIESVCRSFFGRSGPSVHFELFPSTTKSIEALVSLLAHEAEMRERPIKLLVPSDAHYCWTNVAGKYGAHPYLQFHPVIVGRRDEVERIRMREGDFVVAIFTLAGTVTGRATDVDWFEDVVGGYVRERTGSDPHVFVDAALSGCVVARNVLDLRCDADPVRVRGILDSAVGLVQSGFKDYGLSSMLFLDDGILECCAGGGRASEEGLASQVVGGSHPIIRHAPVTSIPESPTLAFLLFAREYTNFRRQSYQSFVAKLRDAIPERVPYEIQPFFPLLKVKFVGDDEEQNIFLTKKLTAALVETYALITIDAEPDVLRLWPTPTNQDIVDAISYWFETEGAKLFTYE